ncbi:uncharacterized protein MKK02DRAFT_42720 [Dioszegia hungarica]|uniref:RRM domain-containing protein n=1 Tax=Dioszegia hungarica TaxID=4972 RepID=A0AA38HBN0_9TREE|nr:uncharacterized protein MKK02DRAFT_42720 [Dioszegia hungarica]KAI9638333.1 hypothetical protein MKK02DRAFT_42720 [Dioszegia hungarica]
MSAHPAPPPPSFFPVPHTAPIMPINLPPLPMHLAPGPRGSLSPFSRGPKGRNQRRESVGPFASGMQGGRKASGGLGLMGPVSAQIMGRFPTQMPPPMLEPNLAPLFDFSMAAPVPPANGLPRPHPHLTNTDLFISNVPADLPEAAIADALRDCLPVRIKLNVPVQQGDRLKPDAYYDWMPRSGTLHFVSLHSAEKALAILIAHPYLAHAGLIVSTYPPPTSPHHLPNILPFPDPPVPARYIRPTLQVSPAPTTISQDPAQALHSQVPSLGELFDAFRPWASLRQITVWLEEQPSSCGPPTMSWGARVLFWYEDEARRFEVGFGATGLLIKGYQIFVFPEQPLIAPPPPTFDASPPAPRLPPAIPLAQPMLNLGNNNVDPEIFRRMGMPVFPSVFPTPNLHQASPPTPLTPSNHFKTPWINHNVFAGNSQPLVSPSAARPHDRRQSVPTGPNQVQLGIRRSVNNMKSGVVAGHARQRTWSVTLSNSVEGELVPTGLVADDGTTIQHGPGQHIRPAPDSGPGSTSVSGLVDYSNVFVKNLDPDINSYFLEDLFSNIGRIISAKVMRDDEGRSRGYGFVSFYSPNEAAHAIKVMHNTRVGSQQIAVTLHEPRRLRPDKLAERTAQITGAPLARSPQVVNKRSSSPLRIKRDRHVSAPGQASSITPTLDTPLVPSTAETPGGRLLVVLPDDQLRIKLTEEVAKIDPIEAEAVVDILWPVLQPHERYRALESRGYLATKYGVAKRELQGQRDKEADQPVDTPSDLDSSLNSQGSHTTSATSIVPPVELIPLAEIDLDKLASRSAVDIMAHLSSPIGTQILDKLGMTRPTSDEAGRLARWILAVREKQAVQRDAEISAVLAKHFQPSWGKRSVHVKVARELVEKEDLGALCKLIAYPNLLDAKARVYNEKTTV